MGKEFVVKLDAAQYMHEYEDTEDVLYPDSSYYRKDKNDYALNKTNRIFKSKRPERDASLG